MGFTFGELPFAIVDEVQLPSDLEEGDYVLGFRYDCEQVTEKRERATDRHPSPIGVMRF